ncbi:MAG: 4-hydroxy-tetrahydrodipicolinate synthase [Planctomycetes bacterium]|jgi:4-hydroxy-tetrahydrodipicolinate synthase|nr:4-hydroxy-tetrahydrodipicolinate synthase [Planctomycetota bacterium]
MFQGVIVALVTPFKNGAVDFAKLDELVEFHVGQGTDAIVPVGTTGESATLSHEEHDAVVARVVKAARKRVPVIAGAGSNCTAEALRLTRHAKEAGADGALHVVPYYNKPTQEGLFRHFEAVAGAGLPVVLYNIPGRTGVDMTAQTVERLSTVKGIVGIKEASGSLDRVSELKALCPKLVVLSGDDSLTLPMLAVGAEGVISVVANLVPRDVKDMIARFFRGDVAGARDAHLRLLPLVKALFLETNPVPVKAAMEILGTISGEVRLPLAPMSAPNREKLRLAIREYGLPG